MWWLLIPWPLMLQMPQVRQKWWNSSCSSRLGDLASNRSGSNGVDVEASNIVDVAWKSTQLPQDVPVDPVDLRDPFRNLHGCVMGNSKASPAGSITSIITCSCQRWCQLPLHPTVEGLLFKEKLLNLRHQPFGTFALTPRYTT